MDQFRDFLCGRFAFVDRQRTAIHIIEDIMTAHRKQMLLQHVTELARVEQGIRELEPWVRDHVVHALLSFVLGIYVNECFIKERFSVGASEFQWKIAGMFHDVGYPVQVAKDIMRPFTDKINFIKSALGINATDVFFRVVPVGLECLQNNRNSLDLIQSYVNRWGLRLDARQEYDRMVATGNVCHGIMSALAVLYVIDLMYQIFNPDRVHKDIIIDQTNWNESYFDNDVLPACAAIFLHNLPTRCFDTVKIDPQIAPLPFLLRLCDAMQDWERPSTDYPQGLSAELFDIDIVDGTLVFHADVEASRKEKLKKELRDSLLIDGIVVT